MNQGHPHQGSCPGDFTTPPISASPETSNKSLSPQPATGLQPITDNSMSSGTPEAGADEDVSEPRLEASRMDTPASDISDDDANLRPSKETQDANTTEEQISYKRALRPTRRTAPSTWIDADTTGDFDPHEEARKARPRRKKAKLSHRGSHGSNREEHTDEQAIEFEPELPPPPTLCLRFNSSAWKIKFSELCAKPERKVKPSHDNLIAGHQLRKRKSISEGLSSSAITGQSPGVRELPSSDFTNHPVARGCFDCLAIGARCSLLDNEHSWPCEECVINNNDCQLVTVRWSMHAAKICFLKISTGARGEVGLHPLPIPRQER
jgi:hypothetical protein